jgi:hypothetical protein
VAGDASGGKNLAPGAKVVCRQDLGRLEASQFKLSAHAFDIGRQKGFLARRQRLAEGSGDGESDQHDRADQQ